MRASIVNRLWQVGRLWGSAIGRHWLFLIVPTWVALTALAAAARLPAVVKATLFIVSGLWLVAIYVFAALRGNAALATKGEAVAETPSGPLPTSPKSTSFVMLSAHGRVSEAEIALFSQQYYFPVVQGREVVGVLSKAALSHALADGDGDRLIVELMVHTGEVASRPALTRAEARS
jgi:hypothetical protein